MRLTRGWLGRHLAVAGLVTGLTLGIACSSDDDADNVVPPTLPAGSGDLDTGLPGDAEGRIEFMNEVEDELSAIEARINELEVDAAALDATARVEVETRITELKTTLAALETQITRLQTASDSAFEDMKSQIEDNLDEARAQVEELEDEVRA